LLKPKNLAGENFGEPPNFNVKYSANFWPKCFPAEIARF